jgi:hypothetical protein
MKLTSIKLATGILTALLATALVASPVAAVDPVVLVIGGNGATPWSVTNIKPADSGTKAITILNNGTGAGTLTVWVSNIVNTEGTPADFEPVPGTTGELGDYMTFAAVSARISSNIAMPALISNLPQSAADTRYIKILSLAAGETVNLNWNWTLPSSTGNVVQGDGLTFDINYALEQIVPPTTPPTTSTNPPTTSTVPPTTSTRPPTTSTTPPTTSTTPPTTSTVPPMTSTIPPRTTITSPFTSISPPTIPTTTATTVVTTATTPPQASATPPPATTLQPTTLIPPPTAPSVVPTTSTASPTGTAPVTTTAQPPATSTLPPTSTSGGNELIPEEVIEVIVFWLIGTELAMGSVLLSSYYFGGRGRVK